VIILFIFIFILSFFVEDVKNSINLYTIYIVNDYVTIAIFQFFIQISLIINFSITSKKFRFYGNKHVSVYVSINI